MSEKNIFPLDKAAVLSDLVAYLRQAAEQPDRLSALTLALQALASSCSRLDQLIEADCPPLDENGEALLYEADGLTIYICHFSPHLTIPPHEHQMAALIALYQGREAHQLWSETADGLTRTEEKILQAGDVLYLSERAIHSVSCLDQQLCKGLHIYLGALSQANRRFFDAGQPRPISEMRFLPAMASQ